MLDQRERELIHILWREGRLSRWELHERSGQTPNGVGTVVARLLQSGILAECPAEPSGGGRPRVPLELDPVKRHVLGLMIAPGTVEICKLNLYGNLIGKATKKDVTQPQNMVVSAAALLEDAVSEETLGIGISVTGLADPDTHEILLSSAVPKQRMVSLQPLYQAGRDHLLVLANDIQALAARWMLLHRAELDQDVLLVGLGDGFIGAAMLIEGHPNRGCVMASNELGHTRMPVETDRCFCGHVGCLERILSTEFLRQHGLGQDETLDSLVSTDREHPALKKMLELVGMGIGNSVNFMRPKRLVLAGEMMRYPMFSQELVRQIRSQILSGMVDRVRIDLWDQATTRSAETAGWAVLANLFANEWGPSLRGPMTNGKERAGR
jgi:transcriptional regulator of PTS gene